MPYKRRVKPTYAQRAPKLRAPHRPLTPIRRADSRRTQPRRGTGFTRTDTLAARLRRETNPLRRRLLFVGYLSQRLKKEGVGCFVVGGEAVEAYTAGQFTTGDIDIVVGDRQKAERLLAEMGFTQLGRVWINPQLNLAVDIVGSSLSGSIERVRTVRVGDTEVKFAAVEDLITERLVSAKYWGGSRQEDLEQATALLANFQSTLDWKYLERRVSEQKVEDYYQAIAEKARQIKS